MEMTALKAKPARSRLPRQWLMTDERISTQALIGAVERLPRGAGIVFRHYGLAPSARRALFEKLRKPARKRRLILLLAGSPRQAVAWKADGWHGPSAGLRMRRMIHSAPAHAIREVRYAERGGADLLFLSPVHATRSHPAAKALGRVRFGLLRQKARRPVIALGGMTPKRAEALRAMGIHGWAAIDFWAKGES